MVADTISSILSKKSLLFLVILISLFFRIEFEITNVDMDIDKRLQLSATKSLLQQKGFDICELDYNNNEITDRFVTIWPPGYSLTIIPFYAITHNYLHASILLDILAICLLFLVLFRFFQLFKLSNFQQLLIFLFLGISYTPFYHLTSTDLLSLTIFQWALYMSLQFVESQKKLLFYSIITGVLLFLTAFFRYSYYPLLFVIPATIFVIGYMQKNKKNIQFALYIGIIAGVFLGIQIVVMKVLSGMMVRDLSETGIFVKSLLQFDAFALKSLVFYEGLDSIFKNNATVFAIFTLVTLAFSVFIIIEVFRYVFQKIEKTESLKNYTIINIVILLVNILFLSYMSLTQKPQEWKIPAWTYVEETRYYAQSMLFFEILIISGLLLHVYKQKTLRVLYSLFLLVIFAYAFLYWANNNYNLFIKKNNQYTFAGENKDLLQVVDIINTQKNLKSDIIFSSPVEETNRLLYVFTNISAVSIHCKNILQNKDLKATTPKTFFILKPHTLELSKQDIQATKIAEFKEFDLYTREIQ